MRSAVAIAAGAALAACTDGVLALSGFGRFAGVPLGLLALPALALAVSPRVRDELARDPAMTLLIVGSAWVAAPFADQHVTAAVVLDGPLPDLIHHAAGWSVLLPAWRMRATTAHPTTGGRAPR
jgi:hypothetical protein